MGAAGSMQQESTYFCHNCSSHFYADDDDVACPSCSVRVKSCKSQPFRAVLTLALCYQEGFVERREGPPPGQQTEAETNGYPPSLEPIIRSVGGMDALLRIMGGLANDEEIRATLAQSFAEGEGEESGQIPTPKEVIDKLPFIKLTEEQTADHPDCVVCQVPTYLPTYLLTQFYYDHLA